jgi:hypothetical protein
MVATITQTVALNNTPKVRFNWGFNDGCFDAQMKHVDRATIAPGELFQLRYDTEINRAYSAGYRAGFAFVSTNGVVSERATDVHREAVNGSYREGVSRISALT